MNAPIGTNGEAMFTGNLIDLSAWRSTRSVELARGVRELPRPTHLPALDEDELRAFWRLTGDWRRAVDSGSAADILEAVDELEAFEMHCDHRGLRHRASALIRESVNRQTTV